MVDKPTYYKLESISRLYEFMLRNTQLSKSKVCQTLRPIRQANKQTK